MSKDFMEDEIYPLTITADRYGGVYSGGNFTAWNLCAEDLPEGIEADDVGCHEFWCDNEIVCGKGRTVSEALADLYLKLKGAVMKNEDTEKELYY